MSEAASNTVSRDSAKWDRAREAAIRRDQYRCQYCRKHEGIDSGVDLQVHHIKPVKDGGTHDLENLTTLCNKCHWKLHNNFDGREEYPPSLIDEIDRATFSAKVDRTDIDDLRDNSREIVELLRDNGPMQLKDIIEETGYSRSWTQQGLESLKIGNLICRVERGIYAYIPEVKYRKMLARGKNERGEYRVAIWDPGEQATLDEFSEGVGDA